MLRHAAIMVLGLLSVSGEAFAGTMEKQIAAVRTTTPLTLDGRLNEPQWQTAVPVMDFTQYDPDEGEQATEVTSVRVLYDDRALYVGVICYDSRPGEIVPQLTRRDRSTETDKFTIQIDSYNDHQTAFVFSTSAAGVQTDGILSQDGTAYDLTWDAVWSVYTNWYRDGWSAEFEIPFNALRFSRSDNDRYVWGINFRRYISRKQETDEWVMVPRKEVAKVTFASVSKMGHISGIGNIDPPLNLSLVPYVSGTSTFETATPVRDARSDHLLSAGIDLKYGLSRNFTFDATVNPDFGQVEVDKSVLNLTVFETLFPEKRPFFLEGTQILAFGTSLDNTSLPLFFSRRIGKRPTAYYDAHARGTVEDNPPATTILGAAKITGHTESGLSLGALTTATDEENATIREPAGNRTTMRTEPRGSYSVVRVKQDFGNTSWIGGIATLASRQSTLPAFSGGVDWNMRLGEGLYALDGYVAGTRASATGPAPAGAAGRLLFSKFSGEHWLYTGSYSFFNRNFNSNDIGYFAQPRDYGGYVELAYRENFADDPFRRYTVSAVPEIRWNWNGVRTTALLDVGFSASFRNFWNATLHYAYSPPAYDDEQRGILGIYRKPVDHLVRLDVTSDQRRRISGTLTTHYELDTRRKGSFLASLSLNVRPASWLELTPGVGFMQTRREEAWLLHTGNTTDTTIAPTPFSVFGERDVDELDVALRGIITFARTFTLQFYVQELLARGRYRDFRRLASDVALVPYDYRASQRFINPDFNQTIFNANVLLRWEYLPGSVLYLVWTQGRFDDNGDYAVGFGNRFRDTFKLPHEDVLLLKMSYWLPL